MRIVIATAFAVPTAAAGYHVVFVLSRIGVPSPAWREVFACLGAVCVGVTAWMRRTVFAETRPLEPGGMMQNPSRPILTRATREGSPLTAFVVEKFA
ncbi:hypothetical protein [Bradyrhizobium jicamae]|uniref:hypothetical protein n=1 Tax=Bradyrhizobium jicamae TaxID=280332 RepID=UPI00289E7455|nr:hypothetical protein [Bradyrhizobium jicamae]